MDKRNNGIFESKTGREYKEMEAEQERERLRKENEALLFPDYWGFE